MAGNGLKALDDFHGTLSLGGTHISAGFNQMSKGTLGFLPSSLCLQVRTLQLSQPCMTGLPAQDREAKLWMSSRHIRPCLWAA